MKVLSIDFDFFQNIPYEVLFKYPDGIDLPQELSNLVWASRLSCYETDLQQVEFDNGNFRLLLEILKNQRSNIPLLIESSHVFAYYFISNLLNNSDCKKTELVNVDLHHDVFNDNEKVDCGNWVGNLVKERKVSKFQWIAKPLSQQMYGLSDSEMKGCYAHFNLSKLLNTSFDAVFICRSDPWLFPSFDTYFYDLTKFCKSHFQKENLQIGDTVKHPRNIPIRNKMSKVV